MAKGKTTTGNADALFSSSTRKAASRSDVKVTERKEDGAKLQRVTADVPEEIAEAARNAVYFTPGMTLRDFLASALQREVQRMEKERGEPFPQRGGGLKKGRRV